MRIGEKLISSPWPDPIFGKFECSCSTVKSYRIKSAQRHYYVL